MQTADRLGFVLAAEIALTAVGRDPVLDPQRLAAVYATGLLDSEPDPAFDSLTHLASVVIGAPFAFATIVDEARSFWKSAVGLPDDSPRQNTVEESFCQYVVRSRTELIVTDATMDERTRDNPSIRSMGVRAWAGFPLLAPDGNVLGSFCIVDTVPRVWSDRDLEVLRTLAAAASREVALHAALSAEREARRRAEALARTLQETLIPPQLPEIGGLDVAACFHPAGSGTELVGDFYDLFHSHENTWSFILGDVCGKGLDAAKVATLARHTIGATMRRIGPAQALWGLNETLFERSVRGDTFLTAICGTIEIDPAASGATVTLASAGHGPPMLRLPSGAVRSLVMSGPLVGVFANFVVPEKTLTLESGSALICYTDGVHEARHDRELFGEERLARVVESAPACASARELAERIRNAVLSFCEGEASDDIALLVLRVP